VKIFSQFFCTFLFCAGADTLTLRGRVVDPADLAVPGAVVKLHTRDDAFQRQTVTSQEGEFRFEALTAGPYLLEARGQLASTQQAIRLEGPDAAPVKLVLSLEAVSTRVVVTASGTAQSTAEVSKAVDVIDSAELEQRGQYGLMQSLRLTPGMRVMQLGGPGTLARVVARGLRAFDTSILVDGFRLRDVASPQGDATGLLGDLMVVSPDRVEVLRGSGSSLYGTHSTGAAVNLVTDQGGGPLHGDVFAEGGGLGFFRGGGRAAGGSRDDRLRWAGGVMHLNVMSGVDSDDRYRNTSGQGFAQYRVSSKSVLSGRIFANDSFLGLNDNPYATGAIQPVGDVKAIPGVTYIPAPNDPDSRKSAHFFSGLVYWTQRFSEMASLRLGYQGLATSRDNRDGPAGTRFEPQFNNSNLFDGRIDTAQARTDLAFGPRHMLSAGYEFEREHYDNLASDENPNAAQRTNARVISEQRSHTAFAQDQMRLLGDRLQVSLSGRIQHFDLDRPQFSGGTPLYQGVTIPTPPNAYTGDGALAYFLPRSGTKLRGHVGNGYRIPSLYERFGTSFFFGAFYPYGDPRLRPERTIAFDAGLDQYFANSKMRVSGTFFYTRLQEVIGFDSTGAITPDTDPYGRFGGYRNTGGGLARGVEITAEASPWRSLRLTSTYTYTNSDERISNVVGGSLRSPRFLDHMFTLLVAKQFGRRVDVTWDLTLGSEYMVPMFTNSGSRPFLFPGPRRSDLAAGYTLPLGESASLRFFTRVENVFDRTYYEEGFRTPGVWATGGMKLMF
jgi:iron complex outermembrane receptor protein